MAMLTYRIIEFEPQYEQAVALLIGQVLKEIGVLPDLDGPLDDGDLRQIPELFSGRGRFWLAIEAEQVIGTAAIMAINDATAKLKCMFVQVERHGSGVGQALFKQALAFTRAQGFRTLILDTHVLMARAHRFYEKQGFTKVRQTEDVYYYELRL